MVETIGQIVWSALIIGVSAAVASRLWDATIGRWMPCSHKFEERRDVFEKDTVLSGRMNAVPSGEWTEAGLHELLKLDASTYVYDICVKCGLTIGRERTIAGMVESTLKE